MRHDNNDFYIPENASEAVTTFLENIRVAGVSAKEAAQNLCNAFSSVAPKPVVDDSPDQWLADLRRQGFGKEWTNDINN